MESIGARPDKPVRREEGPRVKVAELQPDQWEKVVSLEKTTDQVYEARTHLASFFREYRHALSDALEGDQIQRKPGRVLRSTLDHILENRDIKGVSIEETLHVTDDPTDEKYIEQLELVSAVETALDAYKELKKLNQDGSTKPDGSDAAEIDRYYAMRFKEVGQAMWVREELKEQARILEGVREKALSQGAPPKVLNKIDAKIADVQKRAKTFFESRPEAWLLSRGMRLRDMKDTFDAGGRIVETPYVAAKLRKLEAEIKSGRPVFVVGELGSGKTELAKHLAYTRLSAPHLARWEALHPAPAKDSDEYLTWQAERDLQREPVIVSGHRALETEALLAGLEVKRKASPPPEEQVQMIRDAWERRVATLKAQGKQLPPDELAHERDLLERGYLEFFRTPVETNVVLGGVLRAMKEGRPFLFDELNAVPHHILIALVDLLMRKPGDIVQIPIPGAAPFRIEAGYCFIGTGNYKPEDGKRYIGRQDIDAAFLSRLATVGYDYLPMSEGDGSRDNPEENELYHMVVARLVDRDLSVDVPKGSLEQLKGICRVARTLQNVISDRFIDTAYYAKGEKANIHPREVLKENVLSIRHLLPIIDAWKAGGYTQSLEDLLFDKYVSKSDTRPQEKRYIYGLLQSVGNVFSKDKGWPDSMTDPDSIITYRGTEKRLYDVDRYTGGPVREAVPPALEHYSTKRLVEELFGKPPARQEIEAAFFQKKDEVPLLPETLLAIGENYEKSRKISLELEAAGINVFES